jgi:hypothetical protein
VGSPAEQPRNQFGFDVPLDQLKAAILTASEETIEGKGGGGHREGSLPALCFLSRDLPLFFLLVLLSLVMVCDIALL